MLIYLFTYLETGSPYVAQADLEIQNLPASSSQVLGLQVCTTTLIRFMHIFECELHRDRITGCFVSVSDPALHKERLQQAFV
jgi:hypothetical protein